MFKSTVYIQRRKLLKKRIPSGLILFLGNEESPMNYPANTYPFRQDSSFLYFFGLQTPSLAAVIDSDTGKDMILGDDITLEDVIWMGELPKIKERALRAGVKHSAPHSQLAEVVRQAKLQKRKVHYLPPYRPEILAKLSSLLEMEPQEVKKNASEELIKSVVSQRSTKSDDEIREIEKALAVTREMHVAAMQVTRPGIHEWDIAGKVDGICLAHGCVTAFPTILTIKGHIFHNPYYTNMLTKGKLVVMDAGASSPMAYASDITRTIPVSGRFTSQQEEIYEVVLNGQQKAIESIQPGVKYKDIHLATAKILASGLKALGLMKGDMDEAVKAGAHALFFPHGLGHMLGLDVHDMEGLGENFVGYDETVKRSKQFGLAYLRMARELQPGFVLTVEPGIYFIPALIDQWKRENKFASFINYDKVESYGNFTGIRIEDNVLVTRDGHRVLGNPIPKTVRDVERTMAARKD